jgi:hypothetical protein
LPENHGRRERGGYNRRTTVIAAYSSRFRRVEIGALWLFAALFAALAVRGWLSPFEPSAAEIALVLLAGAVLRANRASCLGTLVARFTSLRLPWLYDTVPPETTELTSD